MIKFFDIFCYRQAILIRRQYLVFVLSRNRLTSLGETTFNQAHFPDWFSRKTHLMGTNYSSRVEFKEGYSHARRTECTKIHNHHRSLNFPKLAELIVYSFQTYKYWALIVWKKFAHRSFAHEWLIKCERSGAMRSKQSLPGTVAFKISVIINLLFFFWSG